MCIRDRAKRRKPRDPIPGSSSQAPVRNWSTTPLGLPGTDRVADLPPRPGMKEIGGLVTSFSVVSTSMALEDPELSKQGVFLIDFCDLRLQRTLQEWTATKWLEIDWQFTNRNCYRLLRVSWGLAQISCFVWTSHFVWNPRLNYTVLIKPEQLQYLTAHAA